VKHPSTRTHCSSIYLLSPPIVDPSAIFSKLFTCADIPARYPPSSVRMSWGPYPAESIGSTAAWQNQVVHSYNYGPSGALKLVMYIPSGLLLKQSLLASILDQANNPIITNSQINTNCITQIQARTTGA